MGQRGPVASVTVLPGLVPKRPAPKRVKLPPAAPKPPTTLSAEAKAEWRRVVPELDGQGLLATIDRALLTVHCDAWAKREVARRLLEKEGLLGTGRNGEAVKHPAWMIYVQASSLVVQTTRELFMSPNARLRSQLPEGADDGETEGAGILD